MFNGDLDHPLVDQTTTLYRDPGLPHPVQLAGITATSLKLKLSDSIVTVLWAYDHAFCQDFVNPAIARIGFRNRRISNTGANWELAITRTDNRIEINWTNRIIPSMYSSTGMDFFRFVFKPDAELRNWGPPLVHVGNRDMAADKNKAEQLAKDLISYTTWDDGPDRHRSVS